MTEIKDKSVLQYELSALKSDDQSSEIVALTNATDTATLTIICAASELASTFAFSVLAQFQNSLLESRRMRTNHMRHSTTQLVRDRIFELDASSQDHWMAIYVDASCVRVFGRGKFVCYFSDSLNNYFTFGGFDAQVPYDSAIPLSDNQTLAILVTSSPAADCARVRYLIEASRSIQCTTESLVQAYITWLVTDSAYCVVALAARRMLLPRRNDEASSPRKSQLKVLDAENDRIRMSRQHICQSSDAIEVE